MKKAAIIAVVMAAALGLSACQKEDKAPVAPAETSVPAETSTPAEASTLEETSTEAEKQVAIKKIDFLELKSRRDKGLVEYYDNNYVYNETVNYAEDGHIYIEGSVKNIGTSEKTNIVLAHYARNAEKTRLRDAGATYFETLAPGETKEFKVDVTEVTKGDDGAVANSIVAKTLLIESDVKLSEDTDWEMLKTTVDWQEALKDAEEVPAVKTFDSEAMAEGDKAMRKFYRENYFFEQKLSGNPANGDKIIISGLLQNMSANAKKNITLTHYVTNENGEFVEVAQTHIDAMDSKEILKYVENITAAVEEKLGNKLSPAAKVKLVLTEE